MCTCFVCFVSTLLPSFSAVLEACKLHFFIDFPNGRHWHWEKEERKKSWAPLLWLLDVPPTVSGTSAVPAWAVWPRHWQCRVCYNFGITLSSDLALLEATTSVSAFKCPCYVSIKSGVGFWIFWRLWWCGEDSQENCGIFCRFKGRAILQYVRHNFALSA